MEERADHPRLQNHLNRYGISCQLMQGFDGLDMVPMAAEEALPGQGPWRTERFGSPRILRPRTGRCEVCPHRVKSIIALDPQHSPVRLTLDEGVESHCQSDDGEQGADDRLIHEPGENAMKEPPLVGPGYRRAGPLPCCSACTADRVLLPGNPVGAEGDCDPFKTCLRCCA